MEVTLHRILEAKRWNVLLHPVAIPTWKVASATWCSPWWNLRTINNSIHSPMIDPWQYLAISLNWIFQLVFSLTKRYHQRSSAYYSCCAKKAGAKGPITGAQFSTKQPAWQCLKVKKDWRNSGVQRLDFHIFWLSHISRHLTNLGIVGSYCHDHPWSMTEPYQTWEYRERVNKHWQKSSVCGTCCSPPALAGCCHVKPFFRTDYGCMCG